MKTRLTLAAAAALLLMVPLAAENVNGFENFVLSRNDSTSSHGNAIANFSSRTHTDDDVALADFSSRKPIGFVLKIR